MLYTEHSIPLPAGYENEAWKQYFADEQAAYRQEEKGEEAHMSVTVKLHVLDTSVTSEEEVIYFQDSGIVGNKWEQAYLHVAETPSLEIGDIEGDGVPQVIANLEEVVYTHPVELTESLLEEILACYPQDDPTGYTRPQDRQEAEEFLRPHLGQKVFLIHW